MIPIGTSNKAIKALSVLRVRIIILQLCLQEPVGVYPFRPYLRYFQKINACNINYMAVFDFLKMFPPEQKCPYSDKLLDNNK